MLCFILVKKQTHKGNFLIELLNFLRASLQVKVGRILGYA